MTLMLPALLAFGGGIVSFASPCVVPLVPVYLSLVTGFDVTASSAIRRTTVMRDTALFVAGFSVVFVALGSTAGFVGRTLLDDRLVVARVAGGVIIALALFLAGAQLVHAPRLYGERRLHVDPQRAGSFAAPLLGVAFGFGWTPCVGPVLASVLTVAATQGQAWRGAALLGAYSLGLGVPFLAGGMVLDQLDRPMAWLRRRLRVMTLTSAALMGLLGVALFTGQLTLLDTAVGSIR